MMGKMITWLEVDVEAINLPPLEALKYYTRLSSQRPADEPWAAFLRPILCNQELDYSLGITLVAQYRFVPDVLDAFSVLANKVISEYSDIEKGRLEIYQQSQGNTDALWEASENHLELITPARLVIQVKNEIEKIFSGTSSTIVEEVPE